MWQVTLLAALSSLCTTSADAVYEEDSTCDFRGLRLRDELTRVLAELPKVPAFGTQDLSPYVPGLEIAGFTVEGLDQLTLYGPLVPYCINGTRMLQADFFNEGNIVFRLPWKACSGHEGRFSVRATLFRFTAQFRILESPDEGVKLRLASRIVPVTTQGVRAFVEGAGPDVRDASEKLSTLIPGLLEEMWYWEFAFEFERRFRQASH
uniref:Metastriate one of each protein family n=1 Tax=Rhipicephalus zambeziensis TaxID=60191 RepID=A0A224YIF9_9ACAR